MMHSLQLPHHISNTIRSDRTHKRGEHFSSPLPLTDSFKFLIISFKRSFSGSTGQHRIHPHFRGAVGTHVGNVDATGLSHSALGLHFYPGKILVEEVPVAVVAVIETAVSLGEGTGIGG